MNKRGIVCNEECSKYIMDLTTKIEAQEGLISDLECDVHFWKTKFEDLNAEYNLLLARNNVLEEMLTNERIETGGTMYLLNNKILDERHATDHWMVKHDELKAKLDAVKPYIQHTRICTSNYHDVVTPYTDHPPRQPCNCGLEAIGEQK